MASQGPLYPGNAVNDLSVGTVGWGNPTFALTDNNSYTIANAGSACFLSGTIISTLTGNKKIEKIEIGDNILSYDNGIITRSNVLRMFNNEHYEYYTIKTQKKKIVKVTSEHQFLLSSNEFLKVCELKVGNKLITFDGEDEIITITKRKRRINIFNFEVSEPHTYFANGFVVHNKAAP